MKFGHLFHRKILSFTMLVLITNSLVLESAQAGNTAKRVGHMLTNCGLMMLSVGMLSAAASGVGKPPERQIDPLFDAAPVMFPVSPSVTQPEEDSPYKLISIIALGAGTIVSSIGFATKTIANLVGDSDGSEPIPGKLSFSISDLPEGSEIYLDGEELAIENGKVHVYLPAEGVTSSVALLLSTPARNRTRNAKIEAIKLTYSEPSSVHISFQDLQ